MERVSEIGNRSGGWDEDGSVTIVYDGDGNRVSEHYQQESSGLVTAICEASHGESVTIERNQNVFHVSASG